MRRLVILASLLALPACAGEREMRSVSGQSANILNQYRGAFRDFASRQNDGNIANEARIHRLNGLRDERTGEIQTRLRAWRVVDDRRAAAELAALSAVDANAIVASMDSVRAQATPEALRFDHAAVDSVIKQLVALQRPRGAGDRAQSFVRFLQALRTSYESAVGAAGTTAGAAASASAATTLGAAEERSVEPN